MSKREPYIYKCRKHNYELVSHAPQLKGSLKIFCPICKDEFLARHLEELQNENPNAGKMLREENDG